MTRPLWLLVVMLGAAVRGELVPELPYDDSGETPVVRLEFGKKVKLEGLGPIIVNEDCTMRRIENWNGLSQQERDAAWRRIAERNNRRLAVCRELHEAEEGPMGIDELEADDEERSMEPSAMQEAGAPAAEPAAPVQDIPLGRASVPYEQLSLDERLARDAVDAKALARAERMHTITRQFIQNHLAAGSEKAKQLDAWRVFLEELERKVNTLKWIKTDDIWTAVATLPEKEQVSLSNIYASLSEKLFPKTFDEKFTYLRRVVGLAAAGSQYRKAPTGQVNKVPEHLSEEPPEVQLNLRAKGLTLAELRREGYRVDEMMLEFEVKELIESGYTVQEMKSGGVTVSQLLEGGCLSNSEMALIVHKVGYTLFEVTAADAFTADQLLFAGYARAEIRNLGLHFAYPPAHLRRKI